MHLTIRIRPSNTAASGDEMKLLRDITIRKMLLIILSIFTLIWGVATGLTLKNFSDTQILLENSSQQKQRMLCWSKVTINISVR